MKYLSEPNYIEYYKIYKNTLYQYELDYKDTINIVSSRIHPYSSSYFIFNIVYQARRQSSTFYEIDLYIIENINSIDKIYREKNK